MKTITCRKQQNMDIKGFSLRIFLVAIFAVLFFTGCRGDELTKEYTIDEPEVPEPEQKDSTDIVDPSAFDATKIYIPQEHKANDFYKKSSKWSFARSKQSEHFIVFWAIGYGDNDPKSNAVPEFYRVDIDDLLEKAEAFYDLNINTLKFAETGVGKSNLDTYKMQIYLFYTEEWMAYGAGYDDVIGALWINPATVHPVGSVIAHEIGHSFQYQTFCDLGNGAGFRYGFGGNGGNGFWEQCAQWQAYQSYPDQVFNSNHYGVYCDNYHRHLIHEHYRYASYFIHYYWADKHGIDIIGKLWREAKKPEDPLEAYMRITGISTEEFNNEIYEAASHNVTWDYDALRELGSNYMGKQTFYSTKDDDGAYMVTYDRCPGTTGYNVIPLNVPDAGTEISADFTGMVNSSGFNLVANPSVAGWRYGYVALKNDGTRVYSDMFKSSYDAYTKATFVVPNDVSRLWFVVTGAPTTYKPHAWDEEESNDAQWPYKVKFANTDLLGSVTIDPNETPKDITLTYDISFNADADNYTGIKVNLNENGDIGKVALALVLQPSEITNAMLAAKETPQEGKIAFAAVEPDASLNYSTTANGYGFWYDSQGAVIGWGSDNDSKVFSEFLLDNFEFSIGQYPGKSNAGDTYTLKEALVYTKGGTTYQVTFVFNITIK